jgi:hypothetical protein
LDGVFLNRHSEITDPVYGTLVPERRQTFSEGSTAGLICLEARKNPFAFLVGKIPANSAEQKIIQ